MRSWRSFDLLARPYRWLEFLTLGPALERCRFHYLPELAEARSALVLGDGDGRFLARLLRANPYLEADVIDISPAMLGMVEKRLAPEERARVTLHCADVRGFSLPRKSYDLVVTHFFLDCLFEAEIADMADRIQARMTPGARWIVSEFAVPRGPAASFAGRCIIAGLYRAFNVLTGLKVRSLPDYSTCLAAVGLTPTEEQSWLNGLLVSQLWQYQPLPDKQPLPCASASDKIEYVVS
jgi:SAM-dependent methyltransferase